MPVYELEVYDFNPTSVFSTTTGTRFTYSGGAPTGTATVTDNNTTLTDDSAGGGNTEDARADVTIGGNSSTNADVDAELVWTVTDQDTGETFQVIQFQVEDGNARGYYTVSEQPLIDGHTYEIVDYNSNPGSSNGTAPSFSYADYVPYSDGVVSGTDGNDTIDTNYTGDPQGEMVDGTTTIESTLSWDDLAADNTSIEGGMSTVINGVQVDIGYTETNSGNTATISNETIYTENGDFSDNSSLRLYGTGNTGDTSTVTLDFSSTESDILGEVENVSFRISDLDTYSFVDTVTITAVDAEGNSVTLTITPEGSVSVSGDTATGTADAYYVEPDDAAGAILVTIDGPVSSITIDYGNNGSAQQAIHISDIDFDVIQTEYDDTIEAGDGDDTIDAGLGDDVVYGGSGDDTIIGGAGADIIEGGAGNDTIYAGGGDTITGGTGNDTIIIDPSLLDGNAINIIGSEDAGDGDTDVLDLSGLDIDWSTRPITYDENDPESGSLTLADGTVITFTNIETVICFGKGTRIATPYGARAVEDLKPGDLILTMDNGVQPLRWVGARQVPAMGRFAPIEIKAGALNNDRDLIVSPQHRMLLNGWRSEMLFGTSEVFAAAKHLVNGTTIREAQGGMVTYYHLMFDRHEVIFAEGAPSESFHVSDYSLTGVADAAREELFALFPELRSMPTHHGDTARKCLKSHEAGLLVA